MRGCENKTFIPVTSNNFPSNFKPITKLTKRERKKKIGIFVSRFPSDTSNYFDPEKSECSNWEAVHEIPQ